MNIFFDDRDCHQIVVGRQYIAALGNDITILDRVAMKILHRITGFQWLQGGIFLEDDILAAYTAKQKIFILRVSTKEVLWKCPKPRELAANGDLKCCAIGNTGKLACIARGRNALNEHYLLTIDYKHRDLSVKRIPNCYRVISSLAWNEEIGLTYLSYQANGENGTCCSIARFDVEGNVTELFSHSDHRIVSGYSGKHLFLSDYTDHAPKIWMYSLEYDDLTMCMTLGAGSELIHDYATGNDVLTKGKVFLPTISWISPDFKFLIAYMPYVQSWMSVYHLDSQKLLFKRTVDNVACGAIIDYYLLIGCRPGLFETKLPDNIM